MYNTDKLVKDSEDARIIYKPSFNSDIKFIILKLEDWE